MDAAFVELMRELLDHGNFPAIATHDVAMIEATKRHVAETRLFARIASSSRCSTASAATCRHHWWPRATAYASTCRSAGSGFPYFMRRLGERPANVAFVLRGILRER